MTNLTIKSFGQTMRLIFYCHRKESLKMYTTRYALVLTNIGQNFDENKLTFDETKKMNF